VATPTDAPAQPAAPPVAPADEPVDEEELEARKEVEQKQAKAQEAKKTVLTFKEEIERLEAQIATERELLETERQKRQTALKTERTLTEQLNKLKAENAAPQQQKEIQAEIDAAKALAATAETEIETHQDNIEGMEEALQLLREQQAAAEKEAQAAEEEAEEAQSALERLLSPFALDNIINWLVAHGPTLLGIIIGTFIALWLVGRLDHRLVGMLTSRSDRGSEAHRENRAQTLVAVFHNAGHIIVIITAILLTLGELGVSTASLMGGVAVFGLAIGFGAQNLIRDFFYGFMILLENQYTINDVVKIGDHAGLVERITLRVTVLRDLEGIVHFIPNGEVTSVRNLTHGWSRVVLDIGVAYKEDVDQVMEVLTEVAEEVCENPLYKHLIIADPEMLGVDAFGDSAVVIKMLLKTRPLQQWTVKRAMLYHIKKRFDKLGIEIPFPHRTVYMRAETHAPPEAELPPSTLSSQEN
jgi:small conductance mechanosensitive channel